MFSVIIPVYNAEKHLDKCLQSVINQTHKDIEIIVVDDGSTDNSAEIIEKYRLSDNRIKVFAQKNGGQSAARNSGLKLAAKEYIMFMDSDDFMEVNACERLVEYIKRDKSDVYVFGLFYDYGNKKNIGGQKLRYKKYNDGKQYMEIALKEGNFRTFVHSKLFKRNLLWAETFAHSEKIVFANGLIYEDALFNVQVFCRAKSVSVVPEFFYHYVQRQIGRSAANRGKKDLDALSIIDVLKDHYYKTDEINKFTYAVLVFRLISSCLIYKYVRGYFFNKQAREMINTAIENEAFKDAVKLCAEENGIPKRDKYLAKALNSCPFFYKIIAGFLATIKDIFR